MIASCRKDDIDKGAQNPQEISTALVVPYADRIPSHRFWLVWSHPRPEDLRELEAMRRWAATFATARGSYVASGNYAFVYEITSQPPHTRWR